jgi:3-oxoacyl-[acyl-carrier-protein] synthase II
VTSALESPRTTRTPVRRPLAITGWGVLCSVATDPAGLAEALTSRPQGAVPAQEMFEDPLPRPDGHVLTGFRVRDHLGRKGTSFFDRSTALALVATKQALGDTGLTVEDANRERVGMVLGTTAGSVKSTSEYSRDTFVQERPYLVNPLIFPNAVMNCAAGQAAIWYGLKGVNATIAGGQLALHSALRYAGTLIASGYADALLVGTVEEFSAQSAWATAYAQRSAGGDLPTGEGAAVFVVEEADAVRAAGRTPDAEVLATEVRQLAEPGSAGLTDCIRLALARAGVDPAEVRLVATGENGMTELDGAEDAAVRAVLGDGPERLRIKELVGECHSASSALALAAVLARHRADPALDGQVSVVTARSADGVVGAAVLRGWSRARGDHGQ